MQVRSLGQEDSLEKEMVTHSSILAWKIPWADEPSGIQSVGSQRLRHNWANIHTLQEQVQAFLLSLSPFGFCVVFSHFLLFNHAFYSVYRISITSFLQFLTNHFTYSNFLFYDKNPLDNSTHLSCKILIYKLENQAVFFLLGVFLISSQILVLLFYSWLFQA